MPDANSAEIMAQIDRLPKTWRALVHEYGFKATMALHNDGVGYDDASDALWMMRSAKQAQWLATDFITPRVARSYG